MQAFNHYVEQNGSVLAGFTGQDDADQYVDQLCAGEQPGAIRVLNAAGECVYGFTQHGEYYYGPAGQPRDPGSPAADPVALLCQAIATERGEEVARKVEDCLREIDPAGSRP